MRAPYNEAARGLPQSEGPSCDPEAGGDGEAFREEELAPRNLITIQLHNEAPAP